MSYFVRWTDVNDGTSMIVGREFETPEQTAELIKNEVLEDFNNGLSGTYLYTIIEENAD